MKTFLFYKLPFILTFFALASMQSYSQAQQAESSTQSRRHSDGEFVRKISQENIAIIQLSKLASQKSASVRVKSFAQLMIDEHSRAKGTLASILEKSRITTDAGSFKNNNDSTGLGKGAETDLDTGNGDTQNKETIETNTGTGIDDPTGSASDSRINSTVKPGVPTGTDMKTGMGVGEIPTSSEVVEQENEMVVSLTEEHKELYEKLSALSGDEFDRQYINAMTKEHDKIIKLYEQQAKLGRNDVLRQYAIDAQPRAREHKEQAVQMKMGSQNKPKSAQQKKSNK